MVAASSNTGPLLKVGLEVPSDVIARMFFATHTKGTYNQFGSTHCKRGLKDGDKYKEVVGRRALLGQQEYRRFESYKPTPDDCSYRREFVAKPLDNAQLDRDLCKLWSLEGRDGGRVGIKQPLSSETTHRRTFPRREGPQPRPPTSCKPEAEVLEPDVLLETQAASRRHYQAYAPDVAARARGQPVEPAANQAPLPRPHEAGPFHSTVRKAYSEAALSSLEPTHFYAPVAKPKILPGLSW